MAQLAGTQSAQGREIRGHGRTNSATWTQHKGVKSRSELEVLAQRHGWKARQFTLADLRAMSNDEAQWHETFNKDNFEAACNEPQRKAEAAKTELDAFWNVEHVDDTQYAALLKVQNAFYSQYPQYVRSCAANGEALTILIAEKRWDIRKTETYTKAFEALAKTGALLLSPLNAGVGSEAEITGDALKNYPRLADLLKPESEIKREKRLAEEKRKNNLTSDQWKAENRHAWIDVEGIPNLAKLPHDTRGAVLGRMGHIFSEFLDQEPLFTRLDRNIEAFHRYMTKAGYDWTVPQLNRAFREMVAQKLLVPGELVFDKPAFRRDLNRMTSAEIDLRLQDDPEFRRKMDSL